jgi:hypothetical protein
MNKPPKESEAFLHLGWVNSMRGKVVRRARTAVKLIATIENKPEGPPLARIMYFDGATVDVPCAQIKKPFADDEKAFNAAFQAHLREKDAAKTKRTRRSKA